MNTMICFSVLMLAIVVTMTEAQQDCTHEATTFTRSSCDRSSNIVRSTLTDSQVVSGSQVSDTTLTNARVSGSTLSGCTITGSQVVGRTLRDCTVTGNDFSGCKQ